MIIGINFKRESWQASIPPVQKKTGHRNCQIYQESEATMTLVQKKIGHSNIGIFIIYQEREATIPFVQEETDYSNMETSNLPGKRAW